VPDGSGSLEHLQDLFALQHSLSQPSAVPKRRTVSSLAVVPFLVKNCQEWTRLLDCGLPGQCVSLFVATFPSESGGAGCVLAKRENGSLASKSEIKAKPAKQIPFCERFTVEIIETQI